jgi:mannosyltransferase OCH1-like enzyme
MTNIPLTKIPRNIFQTWTTKNISSHFRSLIETWIENNPNYAYFLFDDDNCKTFIQKHFDIRVYNCYCRIVPGAFKADLWRYCILYVYGGVYADIKSCRVTKREHRYILYWKGTKKISTFMSTEN